MTATETTSLRDLAAEAAKARREEWRKIEERDAAEKFARHHAEMRRNAERFLSPDLLKRAWVGSTADTDLTIDLGDGILLSYEPRCSSEYGPRGERVFLAEKCIACGDLVRGNEVASVHQHGSLATLGEALAAGVDLTRCPCLTVDEDEPQAASARKTKYAHALQVTDYMLTAFADAAEGEFEHVMVAAEVAQALWLAEIRDALYRLGGER